MPLSPSKSGIKRLFYLLYLSKMGISEQPNPSILWPIMAHYGPWALLNLKLNYEICRYISIFTRLENITDTHYVISRGYDMPGFTAMGGFKLSFQLSSAGSLWRANRLLSGSRSGNFVFLTCCYVRLENGFRRVERRFIICES